MWLRKFINFNNCTTLERTVDNGEAHWGRPISKLTVCFSFSFAINLKVALKILSPT
jgi:hypothetical protein